jgi:hypothetical protein
MVSVDWTIRTGVFRSKRHLLKTFLTMFANLSTNWLFSIDMREAAIIGAECLQEVVFGDSGTDGRFVSPGQIRPRGSARDALYLEPVPVPTRSASKCAHSLARRACILGNGIGS